MNELSDFYNGFEVTEKVGNNAFSYDQRENKSIYVAPLVAVNNLDDLQIGERVVFSECENGCEHNRVGLRQFLYVTHEGKHIFIFDNHNHALFFWTWSISQGYISKGLPLVHVDQHKDMREPESYLTADDFLDLQKVFEYTNFAINVGNFIKPALKVGLLSDVVMVDSQEGFKQNMPAEYVLDIDIDIFSDDMTYIDDSFKIGHIKEYMKRARVITIATSPYFIDQEKAIDCIKQLFK